LFYLAWEYEDRSKPADWSPVTEVCDRWKDLHHQLHAAAATGDILHPKALSYSDGKGFLEIADRRWGYRLVTLKEDWRRIYLYCLRIRTRSEILERFAGDIVEGKIIDILDTCVYEGLMFGEDGSYLSLAVAARPQIAAKRIRAAR
jgi:hypothetical protein